MKNYLVALAMCVILCASCTSRSRSDAPIPPEQMKKVLLDIHFAEVYSSIVNDSLRTPGNKNLDSLAAYYRQIFAHHHITQQKFEEAIIWYRDNTDVLDTVYKNIITDLTIYEGKQPAR